MIIFVASSSASATEWDVYEGESIQAAINNASANDTIIAHEGIYEEQLNITKSLDLKAAEGESHEIRAPAPEKLNEYVFDLHVFPGFTMPTLIVPIIMVNGSFDDINVNISGFVINGSSVTPETGGNGTMGILYLKSVRTEAP